MADRTGKFLPVGSRFAAVFALDANGRPNATAVTAYAGVRWNGSLAFEITKPAARIIPHPGNDGVIGVTTLPPTEPASAQLRVSDYRFDIHAILTGIAVGSVGEAKEIAQVTDQAGKEPQVGLLLYQQSQDLDTGNLTWHSYIVPKCRCIPNAGSMNQNAGEITYQIAPTMVKQRLWGKTLVKATDGYSKTAFFEYDTEGQPAICGFLGDGTTTVFAFPTGEEALSVDKVAVFNNGVEVTTGLTVATDDLTFASAPADGDMITVFYEI
jgi:hypothetical protein